MNSVTDRLVNIIIKSQDDPGSFTDRMHNKTEPLEDWKRRSLQIALEEASEFGDVIEQDIEIACDDCCDSPHVDVNNMYIGKVFQWIIDNGYMLCRRKKKISYKDSELVQFGYITAMLGDHLNEDTCDDEIYLESSASTLRIHPSVFKYLKNEDWSGAKDWCMDNADLLKSMGLNGDGINIVAD